MQRIMPALLTLAIVPVPACAVEDEESPEFRTTAGSGGSSGGGPVFNTNMIDDQSVSELLQPMGLEHQEFTLQSVALDDGQPVVAFAVADGELIAYDDQGAGHARAKVVDSTWWLSGVSIFMAPLKIAEQVLIDGWPHYRFVKGP